MARHLKVPGMVDDIQASVMPGVVRALETARSISLSGKDLFGADQRITARVCEVGPYLALKLRAFKFRQQPKDAFDILYTVKHYDNGPEAAIAAFAEEVNADNPAVARTLKIYRCTDSRNPLRPPPSALASSVIITKSDMPPPCIL